MESIGEKGRTVNKNEEDQHEVYRAGLQLCSPGRSQDLHQLGERRHHVRVLLRTEPCPEVRRRVLVLEADDVRTALLPHREVELPDVAGDRESLR